MKKNAMLKVAAVVLVAVILTTCAISSTFAKYVTESVPESSSQARVAKWGVEVNTTALSNLPKLFKNEYNSDGNTTSGDDAKEVVSTGDLVVAPGTYNEIIISSVATGTPEVSGQITTEATLTLNGWTLADDTEYCPLVFYVNDTPIACSTTIAKFKEDVEKAIKQAGTKSFDANQDLSTYAGITIEWEWLFEIDGEDSVVDARNANDTYLADKTTNVPTVQLDITVGVEQTGAAVAKP